MQEKHLYEYAFIRFVPKVERGEFLNVGVILYAKEKQYLDVKYHIDATRLRAFSEEIDIEELTQYLTTWEAICKGGPEGGPIGQLDLASRFRWLTATRSTIIQSSEVHPGMCSDPEKVLSGLFEKYVM